jgi:hypothetical protein
MAPFSGDISALVFKRSVKSDLDKFSLDGQMLQVLKELDGKQNLASVSRSVNMNLDTLKEVLTRLQNFQLIEKVEATVSVLNEEFFDFIQHHLALALGPIAEFLIEDELLDFGDHPEKIPFYRAAELVNLLAHHIPRQEKKVAFQKAMAKKLKETKP